ncbi:MAG TPA: hypothetical protein VKR21_00555 [Solirubrobacteraceae bacterium]|nr:hypothetical protein [Solirubrobacteraceae bacterium]
MAASKDDRVWVLDTETKGTGANMVPLERILKPGRERVPGFTLPERRARAAAPAEPKQPYRFRVVDVLTQQVLADDVDARRAVETLASVRSVVDISIYVWDEALERWSRLPFGEAKALWDLRHQLPA